MVDDISKLYAKILEEQNEKDSKTPIIENHLIEENESQISDSFPKEEPFDNFLLKLSEKIAEHLDISEDVEETNNGDIDYSENNYHGIPLEKQTTKSSYIEELQKMDKGDKSKLISKNDNISATISEQVKEEIGKVKTQISRMAIEGGGGSVAVQYANGGIMRGDLNVTGKYLSGGIDLSTLIGSGGGGGGGLSGTTDRLISGSEVFKLNTDGTFNFPNNIITPQDEVILTLESTKVLDGYYNRLALSPYGFFASDHNGNSLTINSTDNEILIDSNNTYFWKFNNQGALEGPFGTLSVSGNLSATGRVYQNGNDLQSEIESISAISISTKTTVQSNSASWNYQGSDIKALTGGWVGGNSAYTTVQSNSASWALDSTTDTGVRALTSNWQNTFTTVQSNSANWNYQGSDIKALTGEWVGGNAAYTNLVANSAAYLSGVDIDLSFLSVSGNWNSVYSTVNSNSAVNWNYQGSDIKALTGNWQEAYTNLVTNSAAYLSSVDLSFLSVSTNWDSVYTTVLNESASWIGGGGSISGDYLPLSGGTMTGPISFGSLYGSKIDQGVYDSSRSGLSGISLVCSVNYDFNWQAGWITSLQQDRLTPMPLYIDSGAGTSLKIWNGNYIGDGTGIEITHTGITFADNTTQTTAFTGNTLSFDETTKDLSISNGNTVSLSVLVDSTIDTGVRLLTSNWESTFTTVLGNSAHWEGAYTTLQANSGTWGASLSSNEVLLAQISNADSVTLNRGDVVYTFGAIGSVMSVKKASSSSEATSSKTLGIVNDTIIPNGIGYATVAGRIDKLNLGAFNEGDALWLDSTAGNFTNVKAVPPNHLVYLGVVERANNGNGLAYIKVQNGYELNEIHDVLITNVLSGDFLQRNSTNTLWVNGPLSADASNIASGTINAARMPAFSGDITTAVGSTSARVLAIQGKSISSQSPSTGQILQWSGSEWLPSTIPNGGSGGGGLSYYFNFQNEAQSPTTNLSATPNTPKELGTLGTVLNSSYTSGNLSQTSYDLICGFVSVSGNPNTTVIPAGLWDFNIWASSSSTVTNQTMLRLFVYKYNGANQPTLLAESDDINLYDPSVPAQYIASVVFPQTTILTTDRIYIEIRAKATQNNRTITLYFGDGRPSHVHTTLPSVGGTGLIKVVDGVYQTPASLLVDADVASNANIAQSKINGLTDLSAEANSTYTTVNSNSAAWSAVTSYSTLIGDNVTNPLTAVHNLNTKDIIFSVREVTTNKLIQAAGRTVDNNSLELTFNSTPTINQYDLTVLCNGGIAGTSSGTTNVFALTTITSSTYIQNVSYTHNLYSDSITSGEMTVYLLPPANHIAVTQHKKIGSTANVVLSAPNGATIDGQPTYTLMNQYEAIGLYTDGNNYFIQ